MHVELAPFRNRYQWGAGQSAVGFRVGLDDGFPIRSIKLEGLCVVDGGTDVVGDTVGTDVVGDAVTGDAVEAQSSNGFHGTEAQHSSTEAYRVSHCVARPPHGRPGLFSQCRTHLVYYKGRNRMIQ